MTERIIFAGAGGQGIMLVAKVLAQAAMEDNKFVTWLPSYGAEVRGGASRCIVVISDKKISSPYINSADSFIAMNQPSLRKYFPLLREAGILVLNTSLAEPPAKTKKFYLVKIAATDIAIKLGNIKVANIVALGAYLAKKKIINKQALINVMFDMSKGISRELFEINKKAFEEGFNG
ncbi:MAG: 2-oxoacid:acceptor oxidoreductase family protein [Candidatus Omnitrophota bacterium]